MIAMVGALFGARLWYVVEHWHLMRINCPTASWVGSFTC